MMMTSGEAVKYNGSLDAFKLRFSGFATWLFGAAVRLQGKEEGESANVLSGVAGAVLCVYDKLQVLIFSKKYGSGGG
ncbi:hypothetical protein Droror1_Dr00008937 [Drosera rotundifolia]